MTFPQKRQNSITRYRLTEENLVGNVKEAVKNYDLLSVVILCLGGEDRENYGGVLKLLDVLLSPEAGAEERRQILRDDFDIPMTETWEAEVQAVCNSSQGVEEKGRIKGPCGRTFDLHPQPDDQYGLVVRASHGRTKGTEWGSPEVY